MTYHIELVPFPTKGRVYEREVTTLLSDTGPDGLMRLDAMSRFLHDIATLDVEDAGLTAGYVWILRSVTLTIERRPHYLEHLRVATACSGYGKAWAERRTQLRGADGSNAVEAAAIWVNISGVGGRPKSLNEDFLATYKASAEGRHVSARSQLHIPTDEPTKQFTYQVRVSDLDIMGHVNNAIHTQLIEQVLHDAEVPFSGQIHQARLEFGDALEYGDSVVAQIWLESTSCIITLSQRGRICSTFLGRS